MSVRVRLKEVPVPERSGTNANPAAPRVWSGVEYDQHRRRYLTLRVRGDGEWNCPERYEAYFVFNPKAPTVPYVVAHWSAPYGYPGVQHDGHASMVWLAIYPTRRRVEVSCFVGNGCASARYRLKGDPARWLELLSVARQVAARRAPEIGILGFIEDNLPAPWDILATAAPLCLFRALSPAPLVVSA